MNFWQMVSRTAFTQLRYSVALLLLTTAAMLLFFGVPCFGLFVGPFWSRGAAALGLLAMMAAYLPTLAYYGRRRLWALALPAIGIVYLLMTWTSAVRYWQGKRSSWKGRTYGVSERAAI